MLERCVGFSRAEEHRCAQRAPARLKRGWRLNLNLNEKWKPFIRSKMQTGQYRSEGEVLDEALRLLKQRDLERTQDKTRIEALLIEGLDSGSATPMNFDDWDEIEREGQRIIAARKARKVR
jgi:antitoxin ParD1/3/4